ncbi:MAG TPA: hypothetical protein VNT30_06305 [Stellaceae bacterium]|nr:hypothetical protein [Stellaceae bacterium]
MASLTVIEIDGVSWKSLPESGAIGWRRARASLTARLSCQILP